MGKGGTVVTGPAVPRALRVGLGTSGISTVLWRCQCDGFAKNRKDRPTCSLV